MPVFIVGAGRSGTTLLRDVIGGSSRFASVSFELQVFARSNWETGLALLPAIRDQRDEPALTRLRNHLRNRYRIDRGFVTDPERGRISEHRSIPTSVGFFEVIDRPAYFAAVDAVCDPALFDEDEERLLERVRAFFSTVLDPWMEANGCHDWVDDSPVNGRFAPFIVRVFPDAKFVHTMRDGRDVAKSYVRLGWARRSFEVAMQMWHSQLAVTRALGSALGSERYHEVRFSELISEPEPTLAALGSFLGVADLANIVRRRVAEEFTVAHTEQETTYLEMLAGDLAREMGWLPR